MLVPSAIVLALSATGILAEDGCNEFIKQYCPTGASVCNVSPCLYSTTGGEDFKTAILRQHEYYRKQPFTNGSYGGDMMLLTWDSQLANAAVGLLHKLCSGNGSLQHESHDCRLTSKYSSVGQNLMWGAGGSYGNETFTATQAVEDWFNEVSKCSADQIFPFSPAAQCGHYTAVVWARSYRVGCGMVKATHKYGVQTWVACNYAPGGNIYGANYNVFEPSKELATNCRPGSAKGSSGLCEIIDEDEYRKQVGLTTVPSTTRMSRMGVPLAARKGIVHLGLPVGAKDDHLFTVDTACDNSGGSRQFENAGFGSQARLNNFLRFVEILVSANREVAYNEHGHNSTIMN